MPDPDGNLVKEYHFHVYWDKDDRNQHESAMNLHAEIIHRASLGGSFVAKILRINLQPVGPHPSASYEVWVPIESFALVYSFFLHNRRDLSILVHPLTRHELLDHTDRSAFLGPRKKLHLEALIKLLDDVPKQYPELGLGYSNANRYWKQWGTTSLVVMGGLSVGLLLSYMLRR